MRNKTRQAQAINAIELINGKFGSISRFCRIAALDITSTHNTLKTGGNAAAVLALIATAEATRNRKAGNEITAKHRNQLRKAIRISGGVNDFCRANALTPDVIYRILTPSRRIISRRVSEVFAVLPNFPH